MRATPAHRDLETATENFSQSLETRGLIRSANSMDAAMRWVNQLAGQADDTAPDGLTLYLDTAEMQLSDDMAIARLRADIIETWQGAADIDAASRALLDDHADLSRADITQALGDVEAAMANGQIAQSVFDAAMLELTQLHDAPDLARLRLERDLLTLRINDLRDRADELADLRRQMRNPSIS